jgi:hypothetical protein
MFIITRTRICALSVGLNVSYRNHGIFTVSSTSLALFFCLTSFIRLHAERYAWGSDEVKRTEASTAINVAHILRPFSVPSHLSVGIQPDQGWRCRLHHCRRS